MINVLIADDHAIVREGLKQILAEIPDIIVAGEEKDGLEVVEKIQSGNYDVLVLDISMPGKSGFDILSDIKTLNLKIPVLILSMHSEEQYAVRLLKSGASGYLSKDRAPEELVTAIRMLFRGERYITPTIANKLVDTLNNDSTNSPHDNLSDREFQVMRLIASGKCVKEIGEELFLSVKTISTYRARIIEKMGIRTTAELMHYAIKNGLVD